MLRKRIVVLVVFGLLALTASAALAGGITGQIKVRGLRSPAGVLVYLVKAPLNGVDLSQADFVMDQKNLTFRPHVLPVPVGAKVAFPNHDQVNHNVFSLSQTKKFNLGSYGPGISKTVVFDQPGLVELRCDVHAEMLAFIAVLKNPYFALTDDQGRFTLPDWNALKAAGVKGVKPLPPGKYRIKFWHPKLKTKSASVELGPDGQAQVSKTLKRGAPGVLYK